MAWLGFLLGFGFSGGGLYLLYLVVPLEARLRASGLAQGSIDRTLQGVVLAWGLFSLLVTWLYGRVYLTPSRPRPAAAFSVLGLSLLAAAVVFALFLHTGSSLIALSRGAPEQMGDRFTFGPFPDQAELQQLKRQGYTAVVSLLSPAIPFEKVLLDQEIADGQKLGLKVYSYPMLPWISDNTGALAAIRDLAAQSKGRIYFHCYLGKHRVLVVEQMLAAATGVAPVEAPEPLPTQLERGPLLAYNSERILVGPYPTDEEWFAVVLRRQVKEVVLTLDPANPDNGPFIDKARQVTAGYGITLSMFRLDHHYPDPAAVTSIASYAQNADHKVYVMGFTGGNWQTSFDKVLSGGEAPVFRPTLPDKFERGNLLRLGDRLLFGPFPTDDEVTLLRAYGVQEVVSLLDDRSPDDQPWLEKEQAWAAAQGFTLKRFPLPAAGAAGAQVQAVAKYLKESKALLFVHGYGTDARVQAVYKAAQAAGA